MAPTSSSDTDGGIKLKVIYSCYWGSYLAVIVDYLTGVMAAAVGGKLSFNLDFTCYSDIFTLSF
jgi:hypothetical protein